jgi:two-component system CheB/CheR fusion protein
MALHELTTNAIKHGALSGKNGRVDIRWRVEGADGSSWIVVDWKESGVEMSQSRAGRSEVGNGRRLIEEALPYQFGARTTFAIEADGVHCTISLPISGPSTEDDQK